MGIFSKKQKVSTPQQNETAMHTNAPEHWSRISMVVTPEQVPGAEPRNILALGAQLQKAFEKTQGMKLAAFMRTRLTPQGIVEIHIMVEDHGKKVPVYVFPSNANHYASFYHGATKVLTGIGMEKPIYYAPQPLPQTAPGAPFRPFGADLFDKPKEDLPGGKYCMWWSTEQEKAVGESECIKSIDRAFKALSGVESYILAAFLKELKIVPENTPRVKLPQDNDSISLVGPGDEKMVMSMSEEKGLGFHFDKEKTSVHYRNAFWNQFANYAEEWKQGAIERGFPMDYEGNSPSLEHWNFMYKSMVSKSMGEVLDVGLVITD